MITPKDKWFVVLAVIFLTVFGFSAAMHSLWAWTVPTVAPPSGNVAAPVNVGGATQDKAGVLNVGGMGVTGAFAVNNSDLMVDAINHRVGIGTTTPQGTLDVAGKLYLKSNGVNSGELKVNYVAGASAGYYATYAP